MTPIDIKYALELAGYTQADVARRVRSDLKRSAVNAVIKSKSRSKAIEGEIAKLIARPLAEIWPHWYGPDSKRRRRRINTADLYARVQILEAQLAAAKKVA